jgi:hypothetical protein
MSAFVLQKQVDPSCDLDAALPEPSELLNNLMPGGVKRETSSSRADILVETLSPPYST